MVFGVICPGSKRVEGFNRQQKVVLPRISRALNRWFPGQPRISVWWCWKRIDDGSSLLIWQWVKKHRYNYNVYIYIHIDIYTHIYIYIYIYMYNVGMWTCIHLNNRGSHFHYRMRGLAIANPRSKTAGHRHARLRRSSHSDWFSLEMGESGGMGM